MQQRERMPRAVYRRRGHFPWHNPCHFLELWGFVHKLECKKGRSGNGPEGYRWRKSSCPAGNHNPCIIPYIKNSGKIYMYKKHDALIPSHDRTWVTFDLALTRPLRWTHSKIMMFFCLKYDYIFVSLSLTLTPSTMNYGLAAFSLIILSDIIIWGACKYNSKITR